MTPEMRFTAQCVARAIERYLRPGPLHVITIPEARLLFDALLEYERSINCMLHMIYGRGELEDLSFELML